MNLTETAHDCGTTASGATSGRTAQTATRHKNSGRDRRSPITEIIVNEDGRVWFESYGKGMHEAGLRLAASQVESLIGTVAASLGTVANASSPIVEGELQIEGIRFEGLLPPVARKPCCVMRKPAQVLYTLDDYVRDGILHEVACAGSARRN